MAESVKDRPCPACGSRDTARIEWLARQDLNNLVFDRSDGRVAIVLGPGVVHGKSLRDAIDAAMRDTP